MKYTNSLFSSIRENATKLDLSSLLRNSQLAHEIPEVFVVLLSKKQPFIRDLKNKYSYSYFDCDSLHEFFRRGLNLNSFILIAPSNRAECSTHDLKRLVGSRSSVPFEIIINKFEEADELSHYVEKSFNRIQSLASLEISVENFTKAELKRNRFNQSEIEGYSQDREYRFTKRLLLDRLTREIGNQPETFLAEQISKIRKS